MDIIALPVEFDHSKIDSKYRLVNIASQRAKELALGGKPKIQARSSKISTIAILEAVNNQLEFLVGEEAVQAKEKAKKFDYRKLIEEKRRGEEIEELTDLEKDLKIYLHEKEVTDKKSAEELFIEKTSEGAEEE